MTYSMIWKEQLKGNWEYLNDDVRGFDHIVDDVVGFFFTDILPKYDNGSVGISVDITKEERVAENANWVINRFGKIDGLVNNAANDP